MQGWKGRNFQKCTYGFLEVSSFLALYGASRQWEVAKRIRAEHGIERLWEHICSLAVGFYFLRKWRQPLMSKKRSELRMNRCCGRWKYIYGFLRGSFFRSYTVPAVSEMQQGEIELIMAWKKKILFFIYFDIISLTKTFRKYKLIIQML